MKHCPTCKRKFNDNSLNFCLQDGSKLTFFDTEAETLKSAPCTPELPGVRVIHCAFPLDHIVRGFKSTRTRVLSFANWFPTAIQMELSVVAAARNGSEVQSMVSNPE